MIDTYKKMVVASLGEIQAKAKEHGLVIKSFSEEPFLSTSVTFEVIEGRYRGYYVTKKLANFLPLKTVPIKWQDLDNIEQKRYLADLEKRLNIKITSDYVSWDKAIEYTPMSPKDEIYSGLVYSSTLGNLWRRTDLTVQDARSLTEESKRTLCYRVFEPEGYKVLSYTEPLLLKEKVELETPNGYLWNASIEKFYYRNQRCPQERYTRSVGESIVYEVLRKNGFEFSEQSPIETVDYIGKKRRLLIDFYLPKINLAIEYNGEQHNKPIKHFGGFEGYTQGMYRDKLKAEWCRDNEVQLLLIPHTCATIYEVTEAINRWLNDNDYPEVSSEGLEIKRIIRDSVMDEKKTLDVALAVGVTRASEEMGVSKNTIRRVLNRHGYRYENPYWVKKEEV